MSLQEYQGELARWKAFMAGPDMTQQATGAGVSPPVSTVAPDFRAPREAAQTFRPAMGKGHGGYTQRAPAHYTIAARPCGDVRTPLVCYGCGGNGHMKKDCIAGQQAFGAAPPALVPVTPQLAQAPPLVSTAGAAGRANGVT